MNKDFDEYVVANLVLCVWTDIICSACCKHTLKINEAHSLLRHICIQKYIQPLQMQSLHQLQKQICNKGEILFCTGKINFQELMVVSTILEAFEFTLQPFHVSPNQSRRDSV